MKEFEYIPHRFEVPERVAPELPSAWKGLEIIIGDILDHFGVGRSSCIEFGVEYGYSIIVLSSFFRRVKGIDTFKGDIHTVNQTDIYDLTKNRLREYDNITLIRQDYRDYIRNDYGYYNLAHVDIVHTYADTFDCGMWCVEHADIVLFHDTESFPAVKTAVEDIARITGRVFYNYPYHHGLGILVSN